MTRTDLGTYMTVESVDPPKGRKTKLWAIRSKSSQYLLGMVQWHTPWRQYVLVTPSTSSVVFNKSCLAEVERFLTQVNLEWKRARRR